MTVLEVLVHDPLCDWSVGLSKAAAKQAEKGLEQLLKKEDEQRNRLDKDVINSIDKYFINKNFYVIFTYLGRREKKWYF